MIISGLVESFLGLASLKIAFSMFRTTTPYIHITEQDVGVISAYLAVQFYNRKLYPEVFMLDYK